jgi:hypothetical protein
MRLDVGRPRSVLRRRLMAVVVYESPIGDVYGEQRQRTADK